ncbi:hypothetical protein DPEC_G00155500 [Dallia pectoralis]|uniref:Uncharacterized protein n=1 Tax=Dallia pectoralis TaxID=75939 RepID=A0ACC2GKP0_DALPE|nr:hypothetical protein DPEC_G00155500 [Dallia pectoralis]
MTSRWSKRRKIKSMLRATESEIVQQFEKTYTDPNIKGNFVTEPEHVECPSVALESDTHDEATRSLDRYVNKDCDTTDIQSEEESHYGLKRKRSPCSVFLATQQASLDSQPSPPNIYQTLQRPTTSYPNVPFPLTPLHIVQRPSPEDFTDTLKDVAMQKLLTAVTELSKEVKDLREEFRQFRQSCRCGQSDSVGLQLAEPMELPFYTMEALGRAEETLQNPTNRQTMVVLLLE